ncbi:MAG: hypothetical protein J6W84_00720 [Bacteroidales bacterium]|nr:hypothetical protein [Bacteroidales bacterium]
MKRILLLTVAATAFFATTAQTPKISYQAVVRDANNHLVTNTEVTVDVTITYGANTYSETGLTATTNANGLLSLLIGNANGYEEIDWSNATIKTAVSIGGNALENTTTVAAVPYTLNAKFASDVAPNATAITEAYNRIKSDSTSLLNAIRDSATAIRNSIPAAPVNADWEAESGAAEILHKPTINNGILTITLPDGTEKVFTANQAGNTEVVIPPYTVTPEDILDAIGQMTPEQKEIMRQVLNPNTPQP